MRTDTRSERPAGGSARATAAIWGELAAGLGVGLLVLDECGSVLTGNERAAGLLGLTPAQLRTGQRPPGWLVRAENGPVAGSALPELHELAGQVLRTGAPLLLPVLITAAARPAARLWTTWHPVTTAGRSRLVVVLRPVHTDVGHARGLLDALTGLPNRALLTDRLGQALTRARTRGTLTSLVLLDVAGLTGINARFGFDRGDELLTGLAGRLRAGLPADQTVARYGGAVFAVVADHPNGTGEPIAARCRELAQRPVRLAGAPIRPSARVRWATSDGSASVHGLIARLDR